MVMVCLRSAGHTLQIHKLASRGLLGPVKICFERVPVLSPRFSTEVSIRYRASDFCIDDPEPRPSLRVLQFCCQRTNFTLVYCERYSYRARYDELDPLRQGETTWLNS